MSRSSWWHSAARSPLGAAAVATTVLACGATVATAAPKPTPLSPNVAAPAPTKADPYVLNVKFKDGTDVTATGTELDLGSATAQRRLDAIIGGAKSDAVVPVFTGKSPAKLDAERKALEAEGEDVPDLTSFVRVTVDQSQDPKKVLAALQADPLVESAQVVPAAAPPPSTPNLSYPAQADLWNNYAIGTAATIPGIRGGNVKVADIEYGINTNHEDLVRSPGQSGSVGRLTPNASLAHTGWNWKVQANTWEHGTAVAGIIAAKNDNIGVDGITPDVDYTFQSEVDPVNPGAPYRANAINLAASTLGAGDVLTLEMQTWQSAVPSDPGNVSSDPYVPAEYDTTVRAAVETAVANGIIVVAAAGNGNVNLDAPGFNGYWSRANDSGAIIVGGSDAGGPTSGWTGSSLIRSRDAYSTFGDRVDVQALSGAVASTGYGQHLWGDEDFLIDNDDYTSMFSGTSSATAITGGIVAAVSSAYEQQTGEPLTPAAARKLLVTTGIAQDTSIRSGNIGPQSRLKNAADAALLVPQTTITSGPAQGGYSSSATPTFTFTSSQPSSTFECSVNGDDYVPCTSPYTLPTLGNSVNAFYVRASNQWGSPDPTEAFRVFTVDTVEPDTTITSGPATGSTITTNSATFAFSSPESGVTYECRFDSDPAFAPCSNPKTYSGLANGSHQLKVRAVDAAGNSDSTPPARIFTVDVPTQVLTATDPVAPPAGVNLTTDPTLGASLDWIHWNGPSPSNFDGKVGAGPISTWSKYGGGLGTPIALTGGPTFSWTDADGPVPSGSASNGVANGGGNGRGLKFTVPATNTATRKLKLWLGVRGNATTAALNVAFGSGAAVTKQVTGNSNTTIVNRTVTIEFRPLAASDTLTVSWFQGGQGGYPASSSQQAVLYGAALY